MPNLNGKNFRNAPTAARTNAESLRASSLAIAVVGQNSHHRDAAIGALDQFPNARITEYVTHSPGTAAVAEVLKEDFDVVIVDLDSDSSYAMELVENLCSDGSTNVIVYSAETDPDILLRCMRVGAREFLPMPLTSAAMTEALTRVSARWLEPPSQQSLKRNQARGSRGKLLVFMSAKGGAGVTTISCSLAVSLAQDFGQRTLLIDLNFPLGDAALTLGLQNEYSTVNALENSQRLDSGLLHSLLAQHESGLYVLAGPTEMSPAQFNSDAVFKLLRVARQEFDYVVVDAGTGLEAQGTYNDDGATIYLVTQVGIPELRNSNRLIKQLQMDGGPNLEVIVNRFDAEAEGIEENHVAKALTKPVQWRMPNDYSAVRNMQNMGTPLNQGESEIAKAIQKMSESICGLSVVPKSKKKKGLLNLF